MMWLLESSVEEIFSRNGIYLFVLGVLIIWIFKNFGRNRILKKDIPSVKLNRFSILGHAKYVPRRPIYYQEYDLNTYFIQILEGIRQIHAKEKLFSIRVFNLPVVVMNKAESVESFCTSTSILNKALSYGLLHSWLGTGLLTSPEGKWKKRRKLLTPSFHFNILRDFLPMVNEQAKVLIDILKDSVEKEWVNISEIMTLCSLDIICQTTLGVNINAQRNKDSEYIKAVFRATESIIQRMFFPWERIDFLYFKTKAGRQLRKDIDILHAFTKEVIRRKKICLLQNTKMTADEIETDGILVYRKRKALMDLLLDYHMVNKDFTEDDIQEEVDTFTFEGHDTTSIGLGWAIYLIGLYPEVQNKVHEELDRILLHDDSDITNNDLGNMKYLECVIKETLRIYPSVPQIARMATEDITLCGYRIPKGFEIMANIYGLHRDTDVFPNPEVFDPDRFLPENTKHRHPFAYVPFAAGSRNCIGQRFAMMELKTILATVLKRFTVKSLDTRDKILPSTKIVLRPSHPIRIKIIPRHTFIS